MPDSLVPVRDRVSFSKLDEALPLPDLVGIQRESFDWLLAEGLKEVLEEVSPIEDFTEQFQLHFGKHAFKDQKFTEEECKDKDATFSAPLFVEAMFVNKTTGEIKEQEVFMGDFPMMTERGTFIINGTERVVVSQLVRSPGVYFSRELDKTTDKDVYIAKIIPSRGAWLEFDVDKKDTVGVRIDRKRRQNVTVLLKALGWSTDEILSLFDGADSIKNTLEKDHFETSEEALEDIYRKLRPGEPPTAESARTLLENLFFNHKRYDLARVGRYKVNKKLEAAQGVLQSQLKARAKQLMELDNPDKKGWDQPRFRVWSELQKDEQGENGPKYKGILSYEDMLRTVRYLVKLHAGEEGYEPDDIDHFGNRRLRSVGELIQNQIRIGLSRMERVVRERMTTQDVEAITPQTLINIRPVVASIKEFFGTSQLSQFMDQTNPLAGLTHKRRLSALGPGGLSRERAGFEVRDVHPSHYGRMCPIETPEGPNIGLIGSLSTYGRINQFGFIETPYRRVTGGKVTDKVDYLSADEEDRHVIAQANEPIKPDGAYANPTVLVRRKGGEVDSVVPEEVDYMDVSPKQIISVAAALIPFLEHDDANRALMGANMQRQAVPLLRSEAPIVGTGVEFRAAVDAGDVVLAEEAGVVEDVSADDIVVRERTGSMKTYKLQKFRRSNQGTSLNQKPLVTEGDKVVRNQVIADGPSTEAGELALGRNLIVAYMPWEGHNYEDAIIISERLVKDDVLTSIHIEEHEVDARDTKLGAEEITRDIPNVSEEILKDLDERGIVRIGAEVTTGDYLVGKVTPKGETELTPEERLLRAIFGEKAREVRDTSLKVPHGESGKVIGVRVFTREEGDELPAGREPARAGVRRAEAEDLRRRQARRPSREQGRDLDDPARGGHAVPRGRDPRRHHLEPARRAVPDEPRTGARGASGVGGPGRVPQGRAGPRGTRARVDAGVRRRPRARDPRGDPERPPQQGRGASGRRRRQGGAVRRSQRRALRGARHGRGRVHPEAAPPGGRQDPRTVHRPLLDDHAAAARREGAVRRPAVRRDGGVGARGVRRRLRAAGAADDQVRRRARAREGLRGDRQGREHPRTGDPRVVQGPDQGDAVPLPERRGAFGRGRGDRAQGDRRGRVPRGRGARDRPFPQGAGRSRLRLGREQGSVVHGAR